MFLAHLWILETFSMQFAIRHATLNHWVRVLVCGTLESKMYVPSLTDVGGNGALTVCLNRLLAVRLTLSLSTECI